MVMTGEVAIKTRRDAYKQKRVFFVTPQVSLTTIIFIWVFPKTFSEKDISLEAWTRYSVLTEYLGELLFYSFTFSLFLVV